MILPAVSVFYPLALSSNFSLAVIQSHIFASDKILILYYSTQYGCQ